MVYVNPPTLLSSKELEYLKEPQNRRKLRYVPNRIVDKAIHLDVEAIAEEIRLLELFCGVSIFEPLKYAYSKKKEELGYIEAEFDLKIQEPSKKGDKVRVIELEKVE